MVSLVLRNIPVDSGTIILADADYYKDWKANKEWMSMIELEPGDYKCKWALPQSYLEHHQRHGDGVLKITSGLLYVSDPCYVVADGKWMEYLESTAHKRGGSYFEKLPEGVIYINTGGDGLFRVELELEGIRDAEERGTVPTA